jgi:hypothetical protein
MSDQKSVIDNGQMPTHEIVARAILPRFPHSTLTVDENINGSTFDIYYESKLILSLNKRGARYFFPSRRKRALTWERTTLAGRPRLIEFILRDLAEADFYVVSSTERAILKRPVHISRYTRCPQCRGAGGIRIILRDEAIAAENSEIYAHVSRDVEINGAEIKCILCEWIGVREELLRKRRF